MRRPQKTCAICESGVRVVDLQGRADAVPLSDRARQDPAEPAFGHLRPAPAAAQHRDQARARNSRCCRTSRASSADVTTAGGLGADPGPGRIPALRPAGLRVRSAGRAAAALAGPRPRANGSGSSAPRPGPPLWLQQIGGLGGQVTRAGAVLLCGTFLALTLWRPSNGVGRAIAATAVPVRRSCSGCAGSGIGWSQLVTGVDHDLAAYQTALSEQWRTAGAPQEMVDQAGSASCARCRRSIPRCWPSRGSPDCGSPGPGTTGSRSGRSAPRRRRSGPSRSTISWCGAGSPRWGSR